jgi:DNA-binding transcriptional LysR family regulator
MGQPEWNHLQTLLILARTQRLAEAGRRLKIDHSTVSRHIAALETAFGVRLFDRRNEGFLLTAEGERLFHAAEQMEGLMMEVQSDIAGKDLELTGTVKIGAPDGLSVDFLTPRLATFASAHPGLSIELVALQHLFNLTKREADIAITSTRPAKGRLFARKLVDYNNHLYATKEYLSTHEPLTTTADLLKHRVIAFSEELAPVAQLNLLDEIDTAIQPCFTSSTTICKLAAILAGAGIGILPRFVGLQHTDLQCVLPEQVNFKRTFWLSVHADLRRLARIRAICDFIVSEMRNASELFADPEE